MDNSIENRLHHIFSITRINPVETYEWILRKHYAHRLPSISYAFGLYKEQFLEGICTFGSPASPFLCKGICGIEYALRVLELNRLVINNGIPNGASKLIGTALKLLKKMGNFIVVSYADTAYSHIGYVYQATNWLYTGRTKERTDIYTQDGKHSRHYNRNQNYSQNRVTRTAKHRYVYFVGNRKEVKKMRASLRYPILCYPKGKSQKYDASYQSSIQLRLPI